MKIDIGKLYHKKRKESVGLTEKEWETLKSDQKQVDNRKEGNNKDNNNN